MDAEERDHLSRELDALTAALEEERARHVSGVEADAPHQHSRRLTRC